MNHKKTGDRDHARDGVISNLSLGDDESSDSVEFSKEDLHHPTHWRGNTGKQRHSGREKRRRHKGIARTFQAHSADCLRCSLALFGNGGIMIC